VRARPPDNEVDRLGRARASPDSTSQPTRSNATPIWLRSTRAVSSIVSPGAALAPSPEFSGLSSAYTGSTRSRLVRTKLEVASGASARVAVTTTLPGVAPSVTSTLALPSAPVTVCGSPSVAVPALTTHSTVTPAVGTPSLFATTTSGCARVSPVKPLWPSPDSPDGLTSDSTVDVVAVTV
jgi:hypothetical protein